MKLKIAIFIFLILSFFASHYHYAGNTRGIEKYMATTGLEPEVFVHDPFSLKHLNNVVLIIAQTTDTQRKIIYYCFFLATLWLLFRLAFNMTRDLVTSLVFLLLFVYNAYNYLSFNFVFLTNDFTGLFLAGPFVIASFLFFLKERYLISSILTGVSFYVHPGITLWYLIGIFSYLPLVVLRNLFSSLAFRLNLSPLTSQKTYQEKVNLPEFKSLCLFVSTFSIMVAPQVYHVFKLNLRNSPIDPQFAYEIFRFGWLGQTSLWLSLSYNPSITNLIILFSNVILCGLILHHFQGVQDLKIQKIYLMYLGSLCFLIINEILVNVFGWKFSVIYGLCRTSGINFLFLAMLLSIVIKNALEEKKYLESLCWGIFFVNYTVIHFRLYSAILQIIMLGIIALVRGTGISKRWDEKISSYVQEHSLRIKNLTQIGLTTLLMLIVLISTSRFVKKMSLGVPKPNPYREAIEFVNNQTKRGLVLYPFDMEEEFFSVSVNPGFFNTYYIVLFIDLYKYDPVVQQKAFAKFTQLEKEFGINTLKQLKENPFAYSVPWREAWAQKVNRDFIERWSLREPIGYIIREKENSILPYTIVYQNEEYLVYKR